MGVMVGRMRTPQDVARQYHAWKMRGDAECCWFWANGDDVHCCAAFAIACCRESGHWVERSKSDRGRLRSVRELVRVFKESKLFSVDTLLPGVAHLYTVKRNGERYGHVGVLDTLLDDGRLRGWEANVRDSLRVVERDVAEITGWLTVPTFEGECDVE